MTAGSVSVKFVLYRGRRPRAWADLRVIIMTTCDRWMSANASLVAWRRRRSWRCFLFVFYLAQSSQPHVRTRTYRTRRINYILSGLLRYVAYVVARCLFIFVCIRVTDSDKGIKQCFLHFEVSIVVSAASVKRWSVVID